MTRLEHSNFVLAATDCASWFGNSRRQYLNRFKLWGLHKNVKQDDMKILVSKANARLSHAGKQTIFFLDDRPLTIDRLDRFKGRKFIRDGFLPSPSAGTSAFMTTASFCRLLIANNSSNPSWCHLQDSTNPRRHERAPAPASQAGVHCFGRDPLLLPGVYDYNL